jgi:hypothetical protein
MSHLVDYARLCRQVECRHRMLECYLLFRLCLAVRAEEAEYLSDFVQAYYEISVNSSAGFPLIKRLYRCLFSVQSYIEFWRIYRAMLDTRQRMLVEVFFSYISVSMMV